MIMISGTIARSHQSAPTVTMLRSAATGQQWLRLLAALRFHNAATACLTRPPQQQRGTVVWACLGLAETARYALPSRRTLALHSFAGLLMVCSDGTPTCRRAATGGVPLEAVRVRRRRRGSGWRVIVQVKR